MPLKRSPAATIYEVGLTRERKGEGAGGRERGRKEKEKKNLEEASYPNRDPIRRVTFYQLMLSCSGSQRYLHPNLHDVFLLLAPGGVWGDHIMNSVAYRRSKMR